MSEEDRVDSVPPAAPDDSQGDSAASVPANSAGERAHGEPVEPGARRRRSARVGKDDADDGEDEGDADEADEDEDEGTAGADEDADADEADEDDGDGDDDGDDDAEGDGEDARYRRRRPKVSTRRLVQRTLIFVAAVAVLSAIVNVRYPLDEPRFWYFIPSADIAVILLNFAIFGVLSTAVPRWMQVSIVVWLFLVRFLRIADGVTSRYFARRFNLFTDLPLVPEGFRFLLSTWPAWELVLGAVLAIGLLAGIAVGAYRAVDFVGVYLRDRRQAVVGGLLCGLVYFGTANSGHDPHYNDFFSGGFAASATERLGQEVTFFWNAKAKKGEYGRLVDDTAEMLGRLPNDLSLLGGANVYLILVESYGRAMFDWPPLENIGRGALDAFERDVQAAGFTLATGVLDSPTYGGQSWLAHNTIDTGIPTRSQLEFEIVKAKNSRPLPSYFNAAGYRTVLVQPNTTRAVTGDVYAFQKRYYNVDFGYEGPDYAWATMPDQFVLDVIRRREIVGHSRPLFIQYVLVSSHAPWSRLPTVIEDWDRIGDGSVFQRTPELTFPIEWPHFEKATEAYGKSIVYDIDVLRRYLTRYIDDGSLVIVLGDHQPVAEVNGDTWDFGVPVHVLSRNPALVQPFIARGFERGVRPRAGGYKQGLEMLMPNLLVDYSRPSTLDTAAPSAAPALVPTQPAPAQH